MNANDIADQLVLLSSGKFLYVVRVLRDLQSRALAPRELSVLPPGMDGFYEAAFARRFADATAYEAIRPLLGLLCVAREPMTRTDLAAALQISGWQVERLLSHIRDFLTVTHGVYRFDHASIAEWLTQRTADDSSRAGRFAIDEHEASACLSDWALAALNTNAASKSPYLVRQLFDHLDISTRQKVAIGVVTDVNWLIAVAKFGVISTFVANWFSHGVLDAARNYEALRLALLQSEHIFSPIDGHAEVPSPENLASQLAARLPRPVPEPVAVVAKQARSVVLDARLLWPLTANMFVSPALLSTIDIQTEIRGLFACSDERLVLGAGNEIFVWNVLRRRSERTIELAADQTVHWVSMLSDGTIASAGFSTTISLWPAETLDRAPSTLGEDDEQSLLLALLTLPNDLIAVGAGDGHLTIWDPHSEPYAGA